MIWKIVFWVFVMPFIVVTNVIKILAYKYLTWRGYKYIKGKNGFYHWSNKEVEYSENFKPERI